MAGDDDADGDTFGRLGRRRMALVGQEAEEEGVPPYRQRGRALLQRLLANAEERVPFRQHLRVNAALAADAASVVSGARAGDVGCRTGGLPVYVELGDAHSSLQSGLSTTHPPLWQVVAPCPDVRRHRPREQLARRAPCAETCALMSAAGRRAAGRLL
jgi:hypothetical protein